MARYPYYGKRWLKGKLKVQTNESKFHKSREKGKRVMKQTSVNIRRAQVSCNMRDLTTVSVADYIRRVQGEPVTLKHPDQVTTRVQLVSSPGVCLHLHL